MEQRWPIDAEKRKAVVERLTNVIEDPMSTVREVTAAAKALMAAEAQNQSDEQHHDDRMDEGRNRILDLLGADGAGTNRLEAQSSGKEVARLGNSKSPSRKPTRKNKGRKPRQT